MRDGHGKSLDSNRASIFKEVFNVGRGEFHVDKIEPKRFKCRVMNIRRKRMPQRISNDSEQLRRPGYPAKPIKLIHFAHSQLTWSRSICFQASVGQKAAARRTNNACDLTNIAHPGNDYRFWTRLSH